MNHKGKLISISIGTLNCRGFRAKSKRKAIVRQANQHFDLLLMQDTHLDGDLANQTQKEFKGEWEFNNRRNNSGGVAVYNQKNACRILADDINNHNDSKGSIIGRTININDIKIYVISAYAPCVNSTSHGQQMNLDFLIQLEQLAMSKRAKGLEILIGADLNFIVTANSMRSEVIPSSTRINVTGSIT